MITITIIKIIQILYTFSIIKTARWQNQSCAYLSENSRKCCEIFQWLQIFSSSEMKIFFCEAKSFLGLSPASRDLGELQEYLLSPGQLKHCCRRKPRAGRRREVVSLFFQLHQKWAYLLRVTQDLWVAPKCHLDQGHLPWYCWKMLWCLFLAGFYLEWNNPLTEQKSVKLNKLKGANKAVTTHRLVSAELVLQSQLLAAGNSVPGGWKERRGARNRYENISNPAVQTLTPACYQNDQRNVNDS